MLERVHAMVQGLLKDENARNAWRPPGLDATPMSQADFAAFVKAEYARWQGIVKYAGVEPQ